MCGQYVQYWDDNNEIEADNEFIISRKEELEEMIISIGTNK